MQTRFNVKDNLNSYIFLINYSNYEESYKFENSYKCIDLDTTRIHLQELLSIEDQKYLFDRWEFETHIKVDLINQLDEMYWNFYKNMSKAEFIEKFINAVKKNPLNVVSNFISLLLKMKNNDTTSLRLFAGCYIINDKEYLLRAIKWLKEYFK